MSIGVDDVVESLPWIGVYLALNGSGWLVRLSIVPAEYRSVATGILVVVGIVGGYAIVRALGLELEGGRCRAETTDGSRCRLSRDPGADLCHVHKRTHDVRIHPSAIEGGFAGGLERTGDQAGGQADERADERAGGQADGRAG